MFIIKFIISKYRAIIIIGIVFAFILAYSNALSLRANMAKSAFSPPRSLPIYSVQTKEKVAALGINCAWDNKDIPLILAALKKENVKSTFFILGEWAQKYPQSVKSIADDGHEIASHSFSHRDLTLLSSDQIAEEICNSIKVIDSACGQKPVLFRPPSGAYNNLVIDTINSFGCTPIQWDVDTLDWKNLTTDEMLLRVASRTKNGSILLLHSGAPHTAEALPEILKLLKNSSFLLKPVGEIIYKKPYSINSQGEQICG